MKRLVLGAGPHWPKQNDSMWQDTFVDIIPGENIDVVHDLNQTPWPFEDGSYDEISSIQLVEHLNGLVPFMNECHRVLSKGGTLYIETPEAGFDVDMTHADPTHVRCYRKHTFINYFTRFGSEKFKYTDKQWCILHIETTKDGFTDPFTLGNMVVHLMPLK